MGFVDKQNAQNLLMNKQVGAFLLRFSGICKFDIGASINGGFLKNYKADSNNLFDVNAYPITT